MTRWIGFLRAVNVGGRKVATAPLRETLTGAGLLEVDSYLASGNIFFTDKAKTSARLESRIEEALAERFGFEIPTLLRKEADVRASLAAAPFDATKPSGDTRHLVLFVRPGITIDVPYELPKGAGIVRGCTGGEVYVEMTVGPRVPNPAAAIEKEFGVVATGRFVHTVHRIVDSAAGRN